MQAVRRLVPNFIIEKYKNNELRGSLEGAAIFVDLVGFSNMVDALSAHGQHGAEVLAEIMRDVFETLVEAVYEQGGFVIGYAGDAFNAVFSADPAKSPEAKRCLAALVKIQDHMQSHPKIETHFGSFPLAIKLGMGYGKTRWQMFKSKEGKHLTYWMRGEALNRAIFAEERASADQIVIESFALDKLRDIVDVEDANGAFLVTKIHGDLPKAEEIAEPDPDRSPMNLFFPESLLLRPTVGEFRQVINLFIDIPVNISDETLVTPFMQTVYALQDEYGGFFLRPELGDKGFNLLMIWGAPTTREHDLERAIEFVMELGKRTKLALRAGITYRTAYAGFMGASLREDYTAYGWGITLAARLMTSAKQGELWIDEEVAQRAKDKFDVKYLGEHHLKGFAQNQHVYQLLGKRSEGQTIYHGTFIGRETETQGLNRFLQPLRTNHFSGLILISGEAGIGKSRLVHAFKTNSDFPANWISIHTEELIRSAFNPFKTWIKKYFEITEDESQQENWDRLMHIADGIAENAPDPELAAELKRTVSVLAALADLSHPDSLYETLDAKARYENTFIALSTLLRIESLRQPTILLLEDGHWLDDDSAAFLAYFIRALHADDSKEYPIAIIITQRPKQQSLFSAESISAQIEVGQLSNDNIHALAQDILGAPITKDLGKSLSQRAEGNPFFAEQILRYLADENLLTFNEDDVYTTDDAALKSIPLDVNAVLIARLDRLTQEVRKTVQTASVLGREFIVDILVEMLRSQLEELPIYVREAEEEKIWAHLTEIEYIFSHALLRDAAYSMQLIAYQQGLHALAFSAIKEVHKADLKPYYGELAYHAEKGRLNEEALQYLMLAGDIAKDAYQNRQAIDYFSRALALLPESDHAVKFELIIKRVECFYNLGDSDGQLKDLATAETLADLLNDEKLTARTKIRQAYHASIMGDYQNAVQFAAKAMSSAQKAGDNETLLSAYIVLPDALSQTGKLFSARERAEQGLALARKVKNRQREASALNALGLVTIALEDPATAQKYQEEALVIAHEIKDHYLEAKILNNFAISTSSQGDYQSGRDYFSKALAVFQEQGNQTGKGLALANLGWVAGMLGDYPAAMDYYAQSLVITRQLVQKHEEMYTYFNLSASCYGQDLASDAKTWAEKGLAFAQEMNYSGGEAWGYYYLGLAQILGQEFVQAAEALLKSVEIRAELRLPALLIESRAGLIEAYSGMGANNAASKEAEAVFAYLEKNKTAEGTEEPLRIYYALYAWLKRKSDLRATAVLQNAKELMSAQVEKLHSKEAQQTFVQNVPWRRALYNA